MEHNNEVKGDSMDLVKFIDAEFEGPNLLPDVSWKWCLCRACSYLIISSLPPEKKFVNWRYYRIITGSSKAGVCRRAVDVF